MTTFKAFIIDDEPLARLALREYISLATAEIEIAGEAGDGEEALSLLLERDDIDILFVDIQMPRMNGVELLSALRNASLPRIPLIIMLSAYGNYPYVRDSFVLGAFDYMLKAQLDETYIAPVLKKTIDELNRRQRSVDSEEPTDEDEVMVSTMLHRLSVTDGQELSSYEQNEELRKGLLTIKKHLGEKNQEVALIRLSKAISFEHIHRIILQTIRTVTNTDRNDGICRVCRHDERHYTLFFTFPEQCSIMAIRRLTHTMLTDVKIRLQQFLNLHLSIGVSDVANGIAEWNTLFRQAERLSIFCYYHGYNQLFYPESEKSVVLHKEEWDESWNPLKLELLNALKDSDNKRWKQCLLPCFQQLVERFPSSPPQIQSILSDMVWEAGSLIYQNGMSWGKLLDSFPNPAQYVRQLETWTETVEWMELFLQALHEALHPKSKSTSGWLSPIVAKAKAILEKHFNEEIHLSSISEMVGVSESYLSKQFAKETGVNFIPYLTNLRIDKAKESLENGMKIYEVAELVGYVNPEHFSRIFKKVTGVSPLTYRKESEKRVVAPSFHVRNNHY